MTALDIAYVDLFSSSPDATVAYFVDSLGFSRRAEAHDDGTTSRLLVRGETRLVVSSGRRCAPFLDAHGDGVGDIALVCDDVDATMAAAGAATPSAGGLYAVPGFGDVVHTLVPSAQRTASALPVGRDWNVFREPHADAPDKGRIIGLDHVAVCVEGGGLQRCADYYRDVFGFFRYSAEYVVVGGQAMDSIVVRSGGAHATFTLVAPDPDREPGQLDAFLERNGGPGVQHLAFLVDDIVPAVLDGRERGVEFLRTPDSYYELLVERFADMRAEIEGLRATGVLADRDTWGYLLQLFTRSPFERNTLFFELIQRQGSRGFGSANIRALYEAVERDRLVVE